MPRPRYSSTEEWQRDERPQRERRTPAEEPQGGWLSNLLRPVSEWLGDVQETWQEPVPEEERYRPRHPTEGRRLTPEEHQRQIETGQRAEEEFRRGWSQTGTMGLRVIDLLSRVGGGTLQDVEEGVLRRREQQLRERGLPEDAALPLSTVIGMEASALGEGLVGGPETPSILERAGTVGEGIIHPEQPTQEPTMYEAYGDLLRHATGAPEVGIVETAGAPIIIPKMALETGLDMRGDIMEGNLRGAWETLRSGAGEIGQQALGQGITMAALTADAALDPINLLIPLSRGARLGSRTVRRLLPRITRAAETWTAEEVGADAAETAFGVMRRNLDDVFRAVSREDWIEAMPETVRRVQGAVDDALRHTRLTGPQRDVVTAKVMQDMSWELSDAWRYAGRRIGFQPAGIRGVDDFAVRELGEVKGRQFSRFLDDVAEQARRGETPAPSARVRQGLEELGIDPTEHPDLLAAAHERASVGPLHEPLWAAEEAGPLGTVGPFGSFAPGMRPFEPAPAMRETPAGRRPWQLPAMEQPAPMWSTLEEPVETVEETLRRGARETLERVRPTRTGRIVDEYLKPTVRRAAAERETAETLTDEMRTGGMADDMIGIRLEELAEQAEELAAREATTRREFITKGLALHNARQAAWRRGRTAAQPEGMTVEEPGAEPTVEEPQGRLRAPGLEEGVRRPEETPLVPPPETRPAPTERPAERPAEGIDWSVPADVTETRQRAAEGRETAPEAAEAPVEGPADWHDFAEGLPDRAGWRPQTYMAKRDLGEPMALQDALREYAEHYAPMDADAETFAAEHPDAVMSHAWEHFTGGEADAGWGVIDEAQAPMLSIAHHVDELQRGEEVAGLPEIGEVEAVAPTVEPVAFEERADKWYETADRVREPHAGRSIEDQMNAVIYEARADLNEGVRLAIVRGEDPQELLDEAYDSILERTQERVHEWNRAQSEGPTISYGGHPSPRGHQGYVSMDQVEKGLETERDWIETQLAETAAPEAAEGPAREQTDFDLIAGSIEYSYGTLSDSTFAADTWNSWTPAQRETFVDAVENDPDAAFEMVQGAMPETGPSGIARNRYHATLMELGQAAADTAGWDANRELSTAAPEAEVAEEAPLEPEHEYPPSEYAPELANLPEPEEYTTPHEERVRGARQASADFPEDVRIAIWGGDIERYTPGPEAHYGPTDIQEAVTYEDVGRLGEELNDIIRERLQIEEQQRVLEEQAPAVREAFEDVTREQAVRSKEAAQEEARRGFQPGDYLSAFYGLKYPDKAALRNQVIAPVNALTTQYATEANRIVEDLDAEQRMILQVWAPYDTHTFRNEVRLPGGQVLEAGTRFDPSAEDRLQRLLDITEAYTEQARNASDYIDDAGNVVVDDLPAFERQIWQADQMGKRWLRIIYDGRDPETGERMELPPLTEVDAELAEWQGRPPMGEIESYWPKPVLDPQLPDQLQTLINEGQMTPEVAQRIAYHWSRDIGITKRATYEAAYERQFEMAVEAIESGEEGIPSQADMAVEGDARRAMEWYVRQLENLHTQHAVYSYIRNRFVPVEQMVEEEGPEVVDQMRVAGWEAPSVWGQPLEGLEDYLIPPPVQRAIESQLTGKSLVPLLKETIFSLTEPARNVLRPWAVSNLFTQVFASAQAAEQVNNLLLESVMLDRFGRTATEATKEAMAAMLQAAIWSSNRVAPTSAGRRMEMGMTQATERLMQQVCGEIDMEQVKEWVRESYELGVISEGYGMAAMREFTHLGRRTGLSAEELAAEGARRAGLDERVQRLVRRLGYQADMKIHEMNELGDILLKAFFGFDNLGRLAGYIGRRKMGDTKEEARQVIREWTAEYGPSGWHPVDDIFYNWAWYFTYFRQRAQQFTRGAFTHPGKAVAIAEMVRKADHYSGYDEQMQATLQGRPAWMLTDAGWRPLPWASSLLQDIEPAKSGAFMQEDGPYQVFVRTRLPVVEDPSQLREWMPVPLGMGPLTAETFERSLGSWAARGWEQTKGLAVPPVQRFVESGEYHAPGSWKREMPIAGRYVSAAKRIPEALIDDLTARQEVSDDRFREIIHPEMAHGAATNLAGGSRESEWERWKRMRDVPIYACASKKLWEEDPDRAAQYEFEKMRFFYDVELLQQRTGMSVYAVPYYSVARLPGIVDRMTVRNLQGAIRSGVAKEEQGEQSALPLEVYWGELRQRFGFDDDVELTDEERERMLEASPTTEFDRATEKSTGPLTWADQIDPRRHGR